MRKFFSVLLCIILIISICICSSVSGSAVFVIDDALIASIGISMAASVLLSIGIAAVSDSESQYVQFAEACGQIVWEQMVQDYTQAEILAMITIENGKAYFRCPESLYSRLRNFVSNYDFSSLQYNQSLVLENTDFINWPGSNFGTNKQYYALAQSPSPLTVNFGSTVINYIPTRGVSFHLSNASFYWVGSTTTFGDPHLTVPDGAVIGLSQPCGDSATVLLSWVSNSSGNPTDNPNDNSRFASGSTYGGGYFPLFSDNLGTSKNYCVINGVTHNVYMRNDRVCIDNNYTYLTGSVNFNTYVKRCLKAGTLLVNTNNPYLPVNTGSSYNSITKSVETEVLSPSIPGGRVGSDQSVLVPIPSNIVDPSAPDLPLTQSTVKKRVKRGQAVALVPDLPQLQDKTPQDLGVLVVNNTEIEDTVISPTLSTTYFGENSTTFVILPDNPGSTPIPNDDNQPLVSSPYPDVINPGSETITVTANDDIFPTANNPPATTARPSVSVSNPDEVASSAAGEVVEGVSDIVKEGVSELVEPLSPSDIEKGANRMKLMPQLLHKFPFCIPFDFYNAINQFSAPSEVPQFDIPIRVQSLNFDYNVHVDLTNFETAAKISRWFFSVAWVITLIFLTRKVIWK